MKSKPKQMKAPTAILSGTSPIQVRFIGWLVIVCAGGFGGWIWWAASMSAKLDVVIANQASAAAMTKSNSEDVSRLKEWRVQVDTVGSPQMVRRVDEIRREHDDLARRFELHLATTTPAVPHTPSRPAPRP